MIQYTLKHTLTTLNKIHIHKHSYTHMHEPLCTLNIKTLANTMMQFKIHSHINIKPTIKVFPFVSHLYNLPFETSIYFVTLYPIYFSSCYYIVYCPNKKGLLLYNFSCHTFYNLLLLFSICIVHFFSKTQP